MAKYQIINPEHAFPGLFFNGHEVVIGGENRIWNDDSQGQSFPAADCIDISQKPEMTFGSEEYYRWGLISAQGTLESTMGDPCTKFEAESRANYFRSKLEKKTHIKKVRFEFKKRMKEYFLNMVTRDIPEVCHGVKIEEGSYVTGALANLLNTEHGAGTVVIASIFVSHIPVEGYDYE